MLRFSPFNRLSIAASGGLMQTVTDAFRTLIGNASDFFHSLDNNP